jgi:hypothetical protein
MFASIWIGVSPTVSSGTLVQPLLNWSVNQKSQGCEAADDEWCVDASTFTGGMHFVQTLNIFVQKGNDRVQSIRSPSLTCRCPKVPHLASRVSLRFRHEPPWAPRVGTAG